MEGKAQLQMPTTSNIRIRDPFILSLHDRGLYWLFGTTDANSWSGPGVGFDCFSSTDLKNWDGPFPAFRPPKNFWATHHFWAPEVHPYGGAFYMFASFKADSVCRGTQILISEKPEGPFSPLTEKPLTPGDWECLDGTLHIDADGTPWMIFCHEWLQVHDGEMCAIRLSKDLKKAESAPQLLFKASEAQWVEDRLTKKDHVTDGPFIYRGEKGRLFMLWSTGTPAGYAQGVAISKSGSLLGPWHHQHPPLFREDGGHGMIFKNFDDTLMLTLHRPNNSPLERPHFFKLEERDGILTLV